MLLSGTLAGREIASRTALLPWMYRSAKATLCSSPFGHFGAGKRREPTSLGFNAILNWNHLDAGNAAVPHGDQTPTSGGSPQ